MTSFVEGDAVGLADQNRSIMPDWLVPLRGEYRAFFTNRLVQMEQAVVQLHRDGLPQITPVVLATGKNVGTLRRELGRAVWRRIHHDTETSNFLKCLVWMKYKEDASWAEIDALPRTHLRSCRNAIDWPTAQFAARLAAPGRFAQVTMLYRDTIKMGGAPKPGWSLQRLRREHDRLAMGLAIKRASPVPWAAPFVAEQAGFVFTRLVSDRDFVTEGKLQRHCVAAYIAEARAGSCIAMACTGAERATLRFGKDDWELSGFANSDVTPACADAARVAQALFCQNPGAQGHSDSMRLLQHPKSEEPK